MRLSLQQTQKQGLVLTPQMRLALQILQLNHSDLDALISDAVESNPLLERAEMGIDGASGGGADIERNIAEVPSLRGHLHAQLRDAGLAEAVNEVAVQLVDWLDDDGYLRDSDDALCAGLGIGAAALAEALEAVRGLSPVGVFARDLPDCLRIQAEISAYWSTELGLLLDRLHLLGTHKPEAIAAEIGVGLERLQELVGTLRLFSPKPGAMFCVEAEGADIPDVVVTRVGSAWRVELNEARLPKVLVQDRVWEDLSARATDSQTRAYLAERLRSGRWLEHALQQRAATLLRVSQAIVAHQGGYFDAGDVGLAPLTLRAIAADLGLHESTVSRVVANKLVSSGRGVVEMKRFFSAAVGARSGAAVRARIADLIGGESCDDILSDSRLVSLLGSEGIIIARRTVAKYREGLGFGSSFARRREYGLRGG